MNERAFTLVELLVVIAIISILAAILFPVFAQAKASAKASACLSNMFQIGLGVQMYVDDNDDRMFYRSNWANSRSGDTTQINPGDSPDQFRWWNLLMPYVKNDKIWACASDPLPTLSKDSHSILAVSRSYIALSTAESLNVSQLADPADTMVVTEKWGQDWTGTRTDSWIEPYNGDFTTDKTDPTRTFTASNRHAQRLNAAYFDGHAKSISGGSVQSDKTVSGCALIYQYRFLGPNPPTVFTPSTVPGQPNLCSSFVWP